MHLHDPRQIAPYEPSNKLFQRWLNDLTDRYGRQIACGMIGVSVCQLDGWRSGRGNQTPGKPSKRAVWLLWSLTFHPENLRTTIDIITWGKYAVKAKSSACGVLPECPAVVAPQAQPQSETDGNKSTPAAV